MTHDVTEEFGDGVDAADTALINLVGSAFDDGRAGHDRQDVLARGRRLRRRKRAVPAFGALGVIAASTGLALALAGHGGAPGKALNVDNAGFSVHTDSKTGYITVTLRQWFNEDELKQILAKAGIRTVFQPQPQSEPKPGVRSGTSCTWPGATKLNRQVLVEPSPSADTITIDPSRIPSGSVLAFEYLTFIDGRPHVVTSELLSNEPTGCGAR